MRYRLAFALSFALLVALAGAQVSVADSFTDDAFWITYWSQPKVSLYGSDEESFNQNLKEVLFARNEFDRCLNPEALDDDARWLKEHPGARFFIDGYASKRGETIYNLVLSQRRADWVKQSLLSRGVSESQIRLSVGWGELYPTCVDETDECRAKNKLVRFTFLPGS
jgi:outer membrane protein OmpA-like peptidoglycan-associated protein